MFWKKIFKIGIKKILSIILLTLFAINIAYAGGTYEVMEVLKIIDGDTIDVRLDLGFDIYHDIRVRFNGINTPESRTKDLREKELGLKAKAFTVDFLSGAKKIILIIDKKEKFGRYLGKIYNEKGECLNDKLIGAGLARVYHGEKRGPWFPIE